MSTFRTVWRAYGRLLHSLGLVAGVVTFLMMLLVIANVMGRYFFNSPIAGAFEITQSMLTVIVFFSLALTEFHHGHIKVSFLTRLLPPRPRKVLRIFVLLAGAALFAACSWATFEFAWESFLIREQERGSIQYPLYPVKFIVCLGLLLLCIQFILSAIEAFVEAEPEDEDEAEPRVENV